jgi:hypothetical protein
MAQQKGQRAGKAFPRAKAPGRGAVRGEPRTSEDWQRECERLRVELEAARQEIATLRARQEHVLNRIDWVLDSLDTLSKPEA